MISEAHIVPYKTEPLPVEEGPWLVFAPHADDESFGMGGTLAKATAAGIQVELVIMTDGALGGNQDDLVAIRKEEAIAAASLLGINPPVFLDNKDRELVIDEKSSGQVKAEIQRVNPAAVFFPGPFELHPDHRVTALLVWNALQELQSQATPVSYEILVQSPVNTLVDITNLVELKASAMSVYKSQIDENRYESIALAMNQLRSLTLPAEISHAEGFYRFSQKDLQKTLSEIVVGKISSFFI